MKTRKIEKRIYEFLGVNLFRKYALGLWEKTILKLLHLGEGYHLPSKDTEGLKKYKNKAITYASAHIMGLILSLIDFNIFGLLLNGYCIMVQRYNWIRIDDILRKKEKIAAKKIVVEEQQISENLTENKSLNKEETLELPNRLFDFNKMSAKYYLPLSEILYCVNKMIKLGISKEYIVSFVEIQEAYNRTFDINPEVRYQELYNLESCYKAQKLENLKNGLPIDFTMLLALNIINDGFNNVSWQIEDKVSRRLVK